MRLRNTCIGLGLILAGTVTLWARPRAAKLQASDNLPVIRLVGHPEAAPEFKLEGLDGKPVTLEAARGKVVLLNFWATWCGPCRAETPDLIALQSRYKDVLQIIGLAVDVDDPEDVKAFAEKSGINYPVAIASDEVRARYGGITALPTSFLLDTDGRVVQKHVGMFDPRVYELEIRAVLHLAVPARIETFEDTGEIFLKHANRATELPGVDFSQLSAQQKAEALRRFNAESCSCGCTLTLAQCRIYDSACAVSQQRTEAVVAALAAGKPVPRGSAASGRPAAPQKPGPSPATQPQ